MDAEGTDEWLGELGRDLHGPIESCCFFLMATTFWATGGEEGRDTETDSSFKAAKCGYKCNWAV